MRCYYFDKDICVLCQEYKYYNIYCTRCVSVKVCYNCTTSMLESAFINSCPVCKLETTENKKWYKIKFNKQLIVPVNTEQILLDDEKETKFEECCNTCDKIFRNIIILYKYTVLTVGCLMVNYVTGLGLLYMFSKAEQEEKSTIFLIIVPNLIGFVFFIIIGLWCKSCCKFNFDT